MRKVIIIIVIALSLSDPAQAQEQQQRETWNEIFTERSASVMIQMRVPSSSS